MKFTYFLRDKLVFFLCQGLALLFICFLLSVLKVTPYAIFFCAGLLLAADAFFLFWEYAKKAPFYRQIEETMAELDKKYLITEMIERPNFLEGAFFYEQLQQTNKAMNDAIGYYKREWEEYREYIETWVHEVKTPIAASRLLLENHPDSYSESMAEELAKIEGFVEQALFYARSNGVEKDFVIHPINLTDLVRQALKKYARPLIESKVSVDLSQLANCQVYTDSKWLDFILGQLIENAVKYRSHQPRLTWCSWEEGNKVILEIQDNGIGIPAQDVPRVFEKGFTGENGRRYGKSTGIGLYLCHKLCQKLGLTISLMSQVGKGTSLRLIFPCRQPF